MLTRSPDIPRRSAFSLIELLVVILVLLALITIISVAASRVFVAGKSAATESFMRGVSISIDQFNADFGYYPPMLYEEPLEEGQSDRLAVATSLTDAGVRLGRQRFYSVLTLPVYLVGVGPLAGTEGDNDDPARHDGVEGPGFRDPGPDKSWGGARDRSNQRPERSGRVFGPYMDTASGSGDFFARITPDLEASTRDPFVFEDGGQPQTLADEEFKDRFEGFFVFLDAWGQPIRYYKDWPIRDPANPNEFSFARTPIELLDAEVIDEWDGGEELPVRFDRNLLAAEYALLSGGPDQSFADADPTPPASNSQNLGFVTEEIAFDYDNIEGRLGNLTPETRVFLTETIADNVRVLP